jgi:hypothetical protein
MVEDKRFPKMKMVGGALLRSGLVHAVSRQLWWPRLLQKSECF